jgi:hypothetical protein
MLTKQEMGKKNYYVLKICTILEKHIVKLLFIVVTLGIEALVILMNNLLQASEFSHITTPSINYYYCWSAWSQPVLQVGKEVVVTWSNIRTVNRVIRENAVEMHQQCPSASSCIQTCILVEEHNSRYQHSTPCFWMAIHSYLSVLRYTCDIIVAPCCMNSTISTLSCPRKQFSLAFWRVYSRLNFFSARLLNVCTYTVLATLLPFLHKLSKVNGGLFPNFPCNRKEVLKYFVLF